MSITSLEHLTLLSLKNQISKGDLTTRTLEPTINNDLFDKLNDLLVKDSMNHFKETIFKNLNCELIVKTAENVDVDEDMVVLYGDRQYVRNVYITPKYSHIEKENYDEEYNIIEYKEYIDNDWEYIFHWTIMKLDS
jgi:hypothetical protein